MRYTDEQILRGLSEEDRAITLKVLYLINSASCYGHNPKYCVASNTIINLLDESSNDIVNLDVTDEQIERPSSRSRRERSGMNRTVQDLVRPEIRAAFAAAVRKRFAAWQAAHPGVEVKSATIRDPIQLMLVAMASDIDDDGPNASMRVSE